MQHLPYFAHRWENLTQMKKYIEFLHSVYQLQSLYIRYTHPWVSIQPYHFQADLIRCDGPLKS